MWVTLHGVKKHHKLLETLAGNYDPSALYTLTQAVRRVVRATNDHRYKPSACTYRKTVLELLRNCQLVKRAVLRIVSFATRCDNEIKINAG